MTRPQRRIGSELLPVLLILGCLAGSWTLIVSMHRRAALERKEKEPRPPIAAAPPSQVAVPPPAPIRKPKTRVARLEEDPTRKALARIGADEAEQILEAQAADRRAVALDRAARAALAESGRCRRREQLIRGQIDAIEDRVRSAERDLDALAMERDVLARECDSAKATLEKSRTRSSFAILPHRAVNGTWRRPITLECGNGMATLQPKGPSFTLLDMSGLMGTRSSPLVLAVLHELIRIQGMAGPDGSPAIPYIFFVIRPDGIRPYYEARARLEPLGIAFGYELVEQNQEIDFPDLDQADEWEGHDPLRPFLADAKSTDSPPPLEVIQGGLGGGRRGAQADPADDFRWPARPQGTGAGGGGLEGARGPRGFPGGAEDGNGSPPAGGLDPLAGGGFERTPGGGGLASSGGGPYAANREDIGGEPFQGGSGSSPGGLRPGPGGQEFGAGPGGSDNSAGRPRVALATPGMLPPSGGSWARPGMLPPGGAWNRPGGARTGPLEPKVPGSSPGLPAAPAFGAPTGPGASSPASGTLADSTTLGGQPGQSSPFQPQGSPSDSAALQGRTGQGPPSQGQGSSANSQAGGRGGAGQGRIAISSTSQPAGNEGDPFGEPSPFGSEGGAGEADSRSRSGTPSGLRTQKPRRIEVPMEIVVACGPSGVVIHPGGYRLSPQALKEKDNRLADYLRSVVRNRQQVDPLIRPRPTVRFLVEPGGDGTYLDARRQTVLSGMEWPTVLQVADTRVLDLFPRGPF